MGAFLDMTGANNDSTVRRFSIQRFDHGSLERAMDVVAAEEPLEIRLNYWFKEARMSESVAVTMRTPGQDLELAAGFLLSEGIVRDRAEILEIHSLGIEPSNEVVVELTNDVDVNGWKLKRNTVLGASCGICGKRTREAIAQEYPVRVPDGAHFPAGLIESLPAFLCERQTGFLQTGGLHGAALVNAEGGIEASFEDIGRHNALDKLLGACLLGGRIPLGGEIVFLSSRASFELVQKTAMAGGSVLATVGGPSSLAIEAARDCGMTLIGFVRANRFNIYSGEWRIETGQPA
ncbi:MAG TPA: formate dehydrogenase accessory sulfurtransferase FdhD [Bryobacteraceae bacterium]